MTVEPLVFRITHDGVLVAPAQCSLLVVPDFLGHVQAWCARPGPTRLVIDLSNVEVLDPAAFRALIWARRYCVTRGRTLVVIAPDAGVLRPQQQAVLRDLFTPVETDLN